MNDNPCFALKFAGPRVRHGDTGTAIIVCITCQMFVIVDSSFKYWRYFCIVLPTMVSGFQNFFTGRLRVTRCPTIHQTHRYTTFWSVCAERYHSPRKTPPFESVAETYIPRYVIISVYWGRKYPQWPVRKKPQMANSNQEGRRDKTPGRKWVATHQLHTCRSRSQDQWGILSQNETVTTALRQSTFLPVTSAYVDRFKKFFQNSVRSKFLTKSWTKVPPDLNRVAASPTEIS